MINEPPDLTFRVLKATSEALAHEHLRWHADGTRIVFHVKVEGLFEAGRGDLVPVTEDTVRVFEDSVALVRRVLRGLPERWPLALALFACRVRGRRPTNVWYGRMPVVLWPWLDAAGRDKQLTVAETTGESDRKN